ncbi:hypothetical protein ACJMK2_001054, partial [Sinanodonta woodiana]
FVGLNEEDNCEDENSMDPENDCFQNDYPHYISACDTKYLKNGKSSNRSTSPTDALKWSDEIEARRNRRKKIK